MAKKRGKAQGEAGGRWGLVEEGLLNGIMRIAPAV